VFTDLSGAFDTATRQGGFVVAGFSSDPVADNSAMAQVFGAMEFRDWAKQQKAVVAV
jgi:hypothetical protein